MVWVVYWQVEVSVNVFWGGERYGTKVLVLIATSLISVGGYAYPCSSVLIALGQKAELTKAVQSQGKQIVEFRSGLNTTLSVSCFQGLQNIAVSWDGPTPDATFYDLVGTTGNLLTQHPASEVVKYSKQCRQEALKDESEIAMIEREGIAIECQAFKRDGGGTTITIFTE
mgnify:CR=1 FL=1